MTESERWYRLDGKTVLAIGLLIFAPMIPTLLIMLVSGAGGGTIASTAGFWVLGAAVFTGGATADWYFTSYRVTEERFELRKGVLSRNNRWIPRDRIRSVDLTADPVRRIFGLTIAKIGTGQSADSELKLDSLRLSDAELLRQELLGTRPDSSTMDSGVLATLKPAWLCYGALTTSFIAIVWGAIGSAFGSFSELLEALGFFSMVAQQFQTIPLWMIVLGGAVSALATGMLGALLVSVEMWWGFSLTRERTTLRVRRGLLTTRSVSLEERRLRGVEVSEPMVLRWAGGARTNAVATGLSTEKEGSATESKTLLPPAPRARALEVAAATLREQKPPWDGHELRSHPRAAARRRVTWALATVVLAALAATVPTVLGWLPWWCPWVVAVIGVPVGLGFARDAYRNLGHALSERYLIARRGTAIRRTVALRRDGIIGWRMRQSLFQRRAGIISVAATTAAGSGAYEVPDVSLPDALDFADEAIAGLLAPFLERDHVDTAEVRRGHESD